MSLMLHRPAEEGRLWSVASTMAISCSVLSLGLRPDLGASLRSPSTPASSYRLSHRSTVGLDVPSEEAISFFRIPLMRLRIISRRLAVFALGTLAARVIRRSMSDSDGRVFKVSVFLSGADTG